MSVALKRGAIIGCGFFAENHLNAWKRLEGAEIVAACDVDPERLRKAGETFGIERLHTDAAELLDAGELDFVDIATTVGTHRFLVELCAPRVDTVICQKPFAETVSDAEAMVAACAKARTTLLIHENFRWQQAFRMMKSFIDQGRIGTPHFARFSFRHRYDNYVNQPYLTEIERFTIMDVGLHLFDLARHFLGEVKTLSCRSQSLNPKVRGEDAFTALLSHDSGAVSVCDCSFYAQYHPEPFPQTLAVIEGDFGTLELREGFEMLLHQKGNAQHFDAEPPVPDWGAQPWHPVQESVVAFEAHALAVMRGKASPQPSGADNLNTLKLALAAYHSAETGSAVHLAEWREPGR